MRGTGAEEKADSSEGSSRSVMKKIAMPGVSLVLDAVYFFPLHP